MNISNQIIFAMIFVGLAGCASDSGKTTAKNSGSCPPRTGLACPYGTMSIGYRDANGCEAFQCQSSGPMEKSMSPHAPSYDPGNSNPRKSN